MFYTKRARPEPRLHLCEGYCDAQATTLFFLLTPVNVREWRIATVQIQYWTTDYGQVQGVPIQWKFFLKMISLDQTGGVPVMRVRLLCE